MAAEESFKSLYYLITSVIAAIGWIVLLSGAAAMKMTSGSFWFILALDLMILAYFGVSMWQQQVASDRILLLSIIVLISGIYFDWANLTVGNTGIVASVDAFTAGLAIRLIINLLWIFSLAKPDSDFVATVTGGSFNRQAAQNQQQQLPSPQTSAV